MPTKSEPPLSRWRTVLIRKKGEVIGTFEAHTAEEAIDIEPRAGRVRAILGVIFAAIFARTGRDEP